MQHPRQRQLGGRHSFIFRDAQQCVDQRQVGLQIAFLKTRCAQPVVVVPQCRPVTDRAREKTAAQRTIRHEPDAEFFAEGQHRLLRIARPQRIFTLHSRYRVHAVCAANGFGPSLRQPERADFASTN